MTKPKRFHPFYIVVEFFNVIKYWVIPLALSLVKDELSFSWWQYGMFAILFCLFVFDIIRWRMETYTLTGKTIHVNEGVFTRKVKSIPFSKIQNCNQRTPFLYKVVGVTQLKLDTGMDGDDDTITFHVITIAEARRIQQLIQTKSDSLETKEQQEVEPSVITKEERTLHFSPTAKDLFRASFTSLSMFVVIPILLSLYSKLDELKEIVPIQWVEDQAQSFIVQQTWIMMIVLLIIMVCISFVVGIIRTFLKYGKYEVSSDKTHVYIIQGLLNESSFSIEKKRVQAIVIKQPFLKRLFRIAEVKLISAGGIDHSEAKDDINSLFPFLPRKDAEAMISTILPEYQVISTMHSLPRRSLWYKLSIPSYSWILSTAIIAGLVIWVPALQPYTWLLYGVSAFILLLSVLRKILAYGNTQYVMNGSYIQMKHGGFGTELFLTKRTKVIDVSVERGPIQKWFDLATIVTSNRGKPVLHRFRLSGVPIPLADTFFTWYRERDQEISIVNEDQKK
ncbi:membrane-flanked domain-containing protein [Fictibacillus macauensis ZFHKF-1]|uniref:Membrane-flanked domain-containing protein n=1 Tax=Fictibacillus macauensis ZFHKF-1 TaxID=1196324 RepID=I8J401_9BACL|nr:PH domain-containing protein [Fictibacillus macauensis]EIT86486.1 membrane-flanked domain-containing protein [Fictibacillus macauensis ZFHKF-1]